VASWKTEVTLSLVDLEVWFDVQSFQLYFNSMIFDNYQKGCKKIMFFKSYYLKNKRTSKFNSVCEHCATKY